jgi:hypothetical protein
LGKETWEMKSKTYNTKRGNGTGEWCPVSLMTKDKKLEMYTPMPIPLQQMATQKVVYLICILAVLKKYMQSKSAIPYLARSIRWVLKCSQGDAEAKNGNHRKV